MPMLPSSTTTGMTRTTVHRQYNGRAFGFFVLNNLVPIVLNIHAPGPAHYKAVLVFGPRAHKCNPYEDLGLMTKECRKVFLFNVRHYVKCFLPAIMGADGNPTTPFTYNLCQYCGASVEDQGGNLLQQISTRSYRRDKYIYRATGLLQAPAAEPPIFTAESAAL